MRPHNRKELEDGIREMAATTYPKDIAIALGVSDSAIYNYAKQIGVTLLKKEDRNKTIKAFIAENYKTMTCADIGAKFGVKHQNIYWYATSMGLRCKSTAIPKKVPVVRKGIFNDKAFSGGNYENLFIGSWQLS